MPNHNTVTPLATLRGGCYIYGLVSMLRVSRKLVSIQFTDLATDSDERCSNISPILRTHVDGLVRLPEQYLAPHCAGFGRPSSKALVNRLTHVTQILSHTFNVISSDAEAEARFRRAVATIEG